MSHRIYEKMADSLRDGCEIGTPGDAGTYPLVAQRRYQYCVEKTTGSETRVLPSAAAFPVGARFAVFISNAPIALTISGARTSLEFDAAGDSVVYQVTLSDGVKQWSVLFNDGGE